jgi:hypothetical protein
MRYRLGLLVTLAGVLGAVACAETGGESAAPSPIPPVAAATGEMPPAVPPAAVDSPAPSPTPGSAPSPDAGSGSSGQEGWTAGVVDREHQVADAPVVGDFRIAENPDFDRIVFEFQGEEIPSYHIEYIDRPVRQCGSGNVIDLRGDGWLSVTLEPAAAHNDQGEPTIENRGAEVDLPVIREHRLICDFEGQVEWVLGVASPNEYRVMELADPARLVVDVRH